MLGALLGAAGGLLGNVLNNNAADKQADMQMKFAQKGIQWKVADATKAGLHPLAALGANTMSYNPVAIGDMAGPLSDMGQNVGRAIQATTNGTERGIGGALGALQMERAGLENDLLRTQIASQNAQLRSQVGPPMPTDGGTGQTIPGQGATLDLAGGHKIKLPMAADAGQKNEDALGDSGGEVLNTYNAWQTARANPKTLMQMAAEMGYSITPHGMITQNLPKQVPAWFKKFWSIKMGKPMYGNSPERRY